MVAPPSGLSSRAGRAGARSNAAREPAREAKPLLLAARGPRRSPSYPQTPVTRAMRPSGASSKTFVPCARGLPSGALHDPVDERQSLALPRVPLPLEHDPRHEALGRGDVGVQVVDRREVQE